MTPESKSSQIVRLHASDLGMKLLRNNNGACTTKTGRLVRFGLGHESKKQNKIYKSSDLIGITPVMITKDMVGHVIGVFTGVEVKKDGFLIRETYPKKSSEYGQNKFINNVKNLGGIGGFSSNKQDVDDILIEFFERFK